MESGSDPFPRSLSIKKWETYLDRSLEPYELKLLHKLKSEKCMNACIDNIYKRCKDKQLYIPELTDLNGNCLFESMVYHGLASSVKDLREGISFLMYEFQDEKDLFPGQESSFKELFELTNEIEFVYCSTNHTFYKYTYNVMCQDIADDRSWTKLPTQLILMIVSLIFKLEIVVINDENDWVNTINVFEESEEPVEVKTVHLGHIVEAHYVPIDTLEDDEEIVKIHYDKFTRLFFQWGINMEKQKNEI